MSDRLTRYNPKDIIATLTIDNAAAALIAGLFPQAGYVLDGFADGTFFDIAYPASLSPQLRRALMVNKQER